VPQPCRSVQSAGDLPVRAIQSSRVVLLEHPRRRVTECEFVGETNPPMFRVLLKVTDKGDYDWVECGSCDAGWQVAHYVESVG
jgi:hypothetical protein